MNKRKDSPSTTPQPEKKRGGAPHLSPMEVEFSVQAQASYESSDDAKAKHNTTKKWAAIAQRVRARFIGLVAAHSEFTNSSDKKAAQWYHANEDNIRVARSLKEAAKKRTREEKYKPVHKESQEKENPSIEPKKEK